MNRCIARQEETFEKLRWTKFLERRANPPVQRWPGEKTGSLPAWFRK